MSDHSDADSFKSAEEDREENLAQTEGIESYRFPPEEEKSLVASSNDSKALGNSFFAKADFSTAIQTYDKALAICPNYLDYEVAVLRSNIAACHLKLAEWKEAVESATKSLDCLERLDPVPKKQGTGDGNADDASSKGAGEAAAVEEVDDETAARIEALAKSGRTAEDVRKIRVKALMRRAKGRSELGGWSNLAGAEEDYKHLATIPLLSSLDRKTVDTALRTLPPRVEAAQKQEMGEMMGKLKELGNGILKPFGLSTDNFQFVKDEKTGGYSMNFNQSGSRSQGNGSAG